MFKVLFAMAPEAFNREQIFMLCEHTQTSSAMLISAWG